MKGFKPTGYGPRAGFHFPASQGFTGSTGAWTNVQPYIRRKAFANGGFVRQDTPRMKADSIGDQGSGMVRRAKSYCSVDQESGGKSPLRPGYKKGGMAKKMKKPMMKASGGMAKRCYAGGGRRDARGDDVGETPIAVIPAGHGPLSRMRGRGAMSDYEAKMMKKPKPVGAIKSKFYGAGGLALAKTMGKLKQRMPAPGAMRTAPTTADIKKSMPGFAMPRMYADGGKVPRRSNAYTMGQSFAAIGPLVKETIANKVSGIKRSMSGGQRTVGGRNQSVDEYVSGAETGKTTASNYARGGKMRKTGMTKC